jgi:broad specificity phosphatase PhoE
MVRLYIIRHGDPDYDTNKENGGSLTDNGIAEAKALSRILASEERGITHAYTSPLGRARLTAELALAGIPKFSHEYVGDEKQKNQEDHSLDPDETSVSSEEGAEPTTEPQESLNNFEANVPVEDWCRELSTWRQSSNLDTYLPPNHHATATKKVKKPPAIWDSPAPIIRSQLHDLVAGDGGRGRGGSGSGSGSGGTNESGTKGWKESCPDYKIYEHEYAKFCQDADEFLARHGIVKRHTNSSHYYLSGTGSSGGGNDNGNGSDGNIEGIRQQRIAIFCHGGMGLTLLSHLLSIPLPLVHASMWLPPSSVTTILFDEHIKSRSSSLNDVDDPSDIIVTPRAIQIGGTGHLAAAGLQISNSTYEDNGERPAGIKHNFW